MNEAIYLAGGVIVGAGVTLFILRGNQNNFNKISEELVKKASEKLGAEKEVIQTDLQGKKDSIQSLVDEIRKQLKDTSDRLHQSEKERISSFSSLKKELENNRQISDELRGSTDDLKKVLSSNQIRGAFGERVAEDLLRMAGFVAGHDYLRQAQAGEGRPDLTLLLADGTKLQIDVKFPYANLQGHIESKDKESKKRYLEAFKKDVKEKIKQIANKNYIDPEQQTVDFAIAFIPNEMIFSFIYDQMNEIWEEGMKKKVVLAGPFSFTAMLRLIHQTHSNLRLQKDIYKAVSLIQKFRSEYEVFSQAVDVLGNRLESASKQFEAVSRTRSQKLTRLVDQIDNQQLPGEEDNKQLTGE